jgi:quinol monooxygenase YgiN
MIIYEVSLSVDREIAAEYEAWLAEHIEEMLAIEGFTAAEWFEVVDAESERREYVVQYRLRDRDAMERYFVDHAERMRRRGVERFGGRFVAARRVLERAHEWARHEGKPR